eukprot:scaffold8553_cov100-Isochrysis_galbana.AAC.2
MEPKASVLGISVEKPREGKETGGQAAAAGKLVPWILGLEYGLIGAKTEKLRYGQQGPRML